MRTTYHIRSAEKVPNFAARWRAICNYFITPKSNDQRKTNKRNQQYIETTRLHLKRRPQTKGNLSEVLKFHTNLSIHKRKALYLLLPLQALAESNKIL